ncbi:MAG TPA: formate dehydrogenase accessory protein FdhE [Dehalococcoidia bacterium]|nr:formate dehydrogenase accessory protein FdhE [Dehalococcoidia bacterium]
MPVRIDRIIKKLEEQKGKEGRLPQVLEFYQKLVHIQDRVGKRVGVPNPRFSDNEISSRIAQGKPLVGFEDLVIDLPLLRKTFREIAAIFAEYQELIGPIPEQLTEPIADQFITQESAKAWFEGTKLPDTVAINNDNETLFREIIHASLRPLMLSYSVAVIDMVKQEDWRRGYCPVCGGNPDFGFLDNEHRSRWLVCSRCDTEWLFQRLQCPYCGTTDQNVLAYFTDDEGLYRLYVCEQCKHYLKTIDLRQAKSEVLIPLERMYTLDIDKQARELGYSPCN